jgi:hypothetical protein
LLCEAQAIRVQAAYAAYKAAASILQLPVFESFVEKYFLGSGKTEVLSTKTMQDLLISSKDDQRCCIRAVTDAMRFVEQTLFPPRKCTSIAKRKVFRHNGELGFPKVNWSDDNDLYMSIGGHSGWAKGSASCQCFANGGPEYFTMTFYYGVHDRALYNGASFEFLKQHLPPGWAPGPYPFANLLLFYLCGFARDFWVEGWRGTLFIGFGGSNPARQNFFCFANLEEAPAIVGPFRSAHARGLLWKVKDATSASSPRFS